MVSVLIVGHAGLGVLALASSFLPGKWTRRVLVGLSLVGFGFGVAIAVLGVLGDTWRTIELGDDAVVAGAASAVAWLVAAIEAAPRGRAVACALVGVTSTSVVVAATTGWLVPMLLFWICSTLAIAVLAGMSSGAPPVWVALFLSDALLIAALFGSWVDGHAWQLPTELDSWPRYLVLAAAAIRGGAIPVVGVWGAMSGAAAPVAPLLAGGAFVLVPVALGPSEPWTGAGLLALSVGGAVWALWGGRALLPAAGAVSMALLLGASIVAPAALLPGALAAVLTAGVIALWGSARALGGSEKPFALATLPPWVGFTAVASAASVAITEVTSAEEVIDKVPWTLVSVLLPAAFAAGIVVAARATLTIAARERWWPALKGFRNDAMALLATRGLLVIGLAGGMIPGDWLGVDVPYADWVSRRTMLFGAALLLALVAAFLAERRRTAADSSVEIDLVWVIPEPRRGSIVAKILLGASLLLAVASISAVGWFTFEGLRLGFL
jgi:hypothetical protein